MGESVLVIGLGRIGLPVSLVMADAGLSVRGIDVSQSTVQGLQRGEVPFDEPGLPELLSSTLERTFTPLTWDEVQDSNLSDVGTIVITIGIHVLPFPEPADLTLLHQIISELHSRDIIRGRVIILRTTLPVGTTRQISEHISELTGLEEGVDFHTAFIPERLVEGVAIKEERTLPKIIGPMQESTLALVRPIFKAIGGSLIPVSTPEIAEFIKLIDNAWRHTRFAFSNDAAMAAEAAGVDIIEAIQAANQEYDRNSVALPGPVSGYCLGKDPIIFEYAFQEVTPQREVPSVWMTSLLSSQNLVPWVVDRIKGRRVLLAGCTFKENIDDFRMSFTLNLTKACLEKGFEVHLCDPFLNKNAYTQVWPEVADRVIGMSNNIGQTLEDRWDTVVLAVRHDGFDQHEEALSGQGQVIDLWNLYRGSSIPNRIGLGSTGRSD